MIPALARRSRRATSSSGSSSPRPRRWASRRLPGAQPLLDAFHDGVSALGEPFFAWGSIALAAPDPAAVDALLGTGAAGLCLPAHALAGPRRLDRIGPVLERLAAHARAPVRASGARARQHRRADARRGGRP